MSPPSIKPSLQLKSPLASCERTQNMGESKTPEYPEACWLLLERKLQLCPTCIAIYGKWKHHPLYESNPSGYRSPNRFRESSDRSSFRALSQSLGGNIIGPGITTGMAYLHSYDPPICHGDLKPVGNFHHVSKHIPHTTN